MAKVITLAGEQLFATKEQTDEPRGIDTFIFAYIPGQDPSAPIDRAEGLPLPGQIVHQQIVQQRGKINANVVVYSTVLDSVTGPFEFNWVGLYSSANNTLVAIEKIPTVTKTITEPGSAGNTINRNFAMEYSGIAEITGITVSPETWQLDYTARLNGMDELTRQLAADMNGKDWFIEDGFKVEPHSTLNSFTVSAGVGYVSGLRVELEEDHILTLSAYPRFVYVDAWFDGTSESTWKGQHQFTVSTEELTDYLDSSGKQHYLCKIAVITDASTVTDLRKVGAIEDINQRLGAKVMGVINVSEIINNSPEFILPITPELGAYVTLAGHGAANFTITGFGDACPVGYTFSLLIPRTIANTGGAANSLGNYVQFAHSPSGEGIDLTMNARQSGASTLYTYQSYPNATDAFGGRCAPYEKLKFLHEGGGRWLLVEMPSDVFGSNSYGHYTRAANGVQNSKIETTPLNCTISQGTLFVSGLDSRQYPAAYSDAYAVLKGSAVDSPVRWMGFSNNATSSFSYQHISTNNLTGSTPALLEATGRWKPNV
jgi:hypothetical protein